jgi:hypothetical protein
MLQITNDSIFMYEKRSLGDNPSLVCESEHAGYSAPPRHTIYILTRSLCGVDVSMVLIDGGNLCPFQFSHGV